MGVVPAKTAIDVSSHALIWQLVIVFVAVAVWVVCPCYPLLTSWLLPANIAR